MKCSLLGSGLNDLDEDIQDHDPVLIRTAEPQPKFPNKLMFVFSAHYLDDSAGISRGGSC